MRWCAAVQSTPLRVHQVAIGLKMHIQPPMLAMSEGRADGERRCEADSSGAAAAGTLIEFVVIPFRTAQCRRPNLRSSRPPKLRLRAARNADGAGVPAIRGVEARAL